MPIIVVQTSPACMMVATDCLNVVKQINERMVSGQHCMIIKEILVKKESFLMATFSHERREANGEAHRLARMATTFDFGRRVWFNPPADLGIPVNSINLV